MLNSLVNFHLGAVTIVGSILFGFNQPLAAQGPSRDFANRYIAKEAGVKRLYGYATRSVTRDGLVMLDGDVDLPTSKQYEGVAWKACLDPSGQVLWSVRAREQPDHASLFPITSDGDSIWHGGMLKRGIFQLAKFDAKTLRKTASVQIPVEPTKDNAPFIQLHSDRDSDFDLQVSLVQPVSSSVHVAVFSRDLKLLFDKIYAYPPGNSRALALAYLAQWPDRSGYYLCLRHPLRLDGKTGVGIVSLDNRGAVKWANLYAAGSSDQEIEPHQTNDGCILLDVAQRSRLGGSLLVKIGRDGNVNWAITTEGITLGLADFAFPWVPYRFTEPYLFVNGMRFASGKLSCSVFAINYQTGDIAKQVACNFPGAIGFTEKTGDSLYVTLLDQAMLARSKSQTGLLRFDFDLNLHAARSIRNAEPHWPNFHTSLPGRFIFSYSYNDQGTVVAETTDENFESASSCGVLQKANYSVAKSNFSARPANVAKIPLPPVTVSEANSKTSEADLQLEPFDLAVSACR
jgi:hypothetical protein